MDINNLINKSKIIRQKSDEVKNKLYEAETYLMNKQKTRKYYNYLYIVMIFGLSVVLGYIYYINLNNNIVTTDIIVNNEEKKRFTLKKWLKPNNILLSALMFKILQTTKFLISHTRKLENIINLLLINT